MDVVPLPERKKPNFLRATKEQLDILMAGFAVSDISSKVHLEALKEATGLPTKWIASWFTRQRKKVATASGRVRVHNNAMVEGIKHDDTTTTTAMSIQEIAAFKTEHSEPTLLETLRPSVDSESEQKPVISKKTMKKTRKPTKKRINDPTPYPSSSPFKPPFMSASQLSRPIPSPSEHHYLQAQPQPADRASPSSTFILREMVPVAYNPPTPNTNDSVSPSTTTIDPQPSEASSPGLSAVHPFFATASSNVIPSLPPDASIYSDSMTSPNTNYNPRVLYAETVTPCLGFVHSWQDLVTESPQGNSYNNEKPVSQKSRESINTLNTFNPRASTSAQRKPALRPLLPLLSLNSPCRNTVPAYQSLPHYSQASSGISQARDDRNAKENRSIHQLLTSTPRTSAKLRSSGPRVLPSLFTTTDLTIAGTSRSIQSPTDGAIPTSIATWAHTSQQHSFVQTMMTQSPESLPVVQNENETQIDYQPSSLFDSTTAPLKHLDVLAPFPDEDLSVDEIMSRLLDSQLATENPFQAAMGLVFASKLGLNWDYT